MDRDNNDTPVVVGHYKPLIANQNYTKPIMNGDLSFPKSYNPSIATQSNGGSHLSKVRGPVVNGHLNVVKGHLPGKVQFTKELVTNFTSKMDFKTKVPTISANAYLMFIAIYLFAIFLGALRAPTIHENPCLNSIFGIFGCIPGSFGDNSNIVLKNK